MNQRPTALITGGARRVGAAIARRLAAAGFDLCITYRTSDAAAQQLSQELSAQGAKAIAVQADFSDPTSAVQTIERGFRSTFGKLSVLVNNASLFPRGNLGAVSIEQLRQCQAIHVETPLLLIQAFADDLRTARGSIVNMVDLLAEQPHPNLLAYCASKAALNNLTRALAREFAPVVTVNSIAPGVVEWPDDYTMEMKQKYLQKVPLQRAGTPQDVAELVHFLITTGKYITGQTLRLDGGRSIVG